MTTTWAQATTARTAPVILAANLATAASNGVNVAGFDDTAPQRAIFEIDARALSAEEQLRVALAQSGFITTAHLAGDDFVDQALSWFDLDNGQGGKGRFPASRAVWTLRLTNASSGPYTLSTAQSEYVAQADDGTYFESAPLAAVQIPAGATVSARFVATAAGTSGNQNPGNVTHLAVGRPGLWVTNASPATLDTAARDQETNAEAIARALGRWSTLGAGWTRASFDYLVPQAAPTLTRWLVLGNTVGAGSIEVVLANAAGPSTAPENAAVLAYLGRPDVMTLGTGGLYASSATTKTVVVVGSIVGDGTNGALLANAKAALDILARGFPVGGDEDGLLPLDLLKAILMGGAWPAEKPLTITGPRGTVSSFVLPGFTGAKSLALSSPTANAAFALTDVLAFAYTALFVS